MPAAQRYEYLDAIRGIAALAVVVWHWQHFMLLEGSKLTWPPAGGEPVRTGEPFYLLLKPLYEAGFIAVDLFFVISGFVFFFLYETSIARGQTTASRFFVYRFSRLYPLYFVTLVLAAILEGLFIVRTEQPFVSGQVDPLHFAKNLLFVHVPDMSINGPAWSLCIEIMMYAIFWIIARLGGLKGWIGGLGLFAIGVTLQLTMHSVFFDQFGRGMAGFFSGGLTFRLFQYLGDAATQVALRQMLVRLAFGLAVVGWCATIFVAETGQNTFGLGGVNLKIPSISVRYGLFPLTVLAVALWNQRHTESVALFRWLGSISYSSYLIHFPLQVGLALLIFHGFLPTSLWASPVAFVAFFAVLLVLSTLSFNRFEMPAQVWLRKRLLQRRAARELV